VRGNLILAPTFLQPLSFSSHYLSQPLPFLVGAMEAAGGTKGDSNFPSHLATIRPIRTYVRLVRTNGNAGPGGDVLCICPHLISRSSPLEVNLKCFTCFESGFQVPGRKRLPFLRGEIPSCPYNVLDLDGDVCQLRDRSYASTRLSPSYLSSIDIPVT
jgi:hypothetical protein